MLTMRSFAVSTFLVTVGLLLAPALGLAQDSQPAPKPIEAITRPSAEFMPWFIRPGIIAKVPVEEGQVVKVGQALMHQEDAAEQANIEQLRADANDNTRIQAREEELKQKKVDLARYDEAFKKNPGAINAMEYDRAKLDVSIAKAQLDLEKFNKEQAGRKQIEMELQVKRMLLASPIDGVVEKLLIHEGEVSGDRPVMRVVKIDPLYVDVPVPVAQARRLQQAIEKGQAQAIKVLFAQGSDSGVESIKADPAKGVAVEAKVRMISAEADGGSLTRRVQVEVPNPARRPAGEHVLVIIPEADAASGSADVTAIK